MQMICMCYKFINSIDIYIFQQRKTDRLPKKKQRKLYKHQIANLHFKQLMNYINLKEQNLGIFSSYLLLLVSSLKLYDETF